MNTVYLVGYIVIGLVVYVLTTTNKIKVGLSPMVVAILWFPIGVLLAWFKYKSFISKNSPNRFF